MSADCAMVAGSQNSLEPATDIQMIQRVPSFMRLNKQNSDDYDPKVVSLGPYHHGKLELKFVEDFKPMALEMFISGSNKDKEFFLGEILRQIDKVRSCYVEDFTKSYNNFDFAQMMLLDACFALQHICYFFEYQDFSYLDSMFNDYLGPAVLLATIRDMSLLENQLPFWILKLLFYSRYGRDKYQFDYLALIYCHSICVPAGGVNEELLETEPAHLLEFSRRTLLDVKDDKDIQQDVCLGKFLKSECINFGCLDRRRKKELELPLVTRSLFRSVMELKLKGIHFSPSGINSLNSASFTSHWSYRKLSLPRQQVGENTRPLFQNLIACEICPKGVRTADKSVTAYIGFMKSLITSPNDVRELREKKILNNRLGSDEDVVQVFRTLNTHGIEPSINFNEIRQKIELHCRSKSRAWIAELINNYFRSPWTIITLVATTFLLFLSTVQTYYASPFHPSGKGS